MPPSWLRFGRKVHLSLCQSWVVGSSLIDTVLFLNDSLWLAMSTMTCSSQKAQMSTQAQHALLLHPWFTRPSRHLRLSSSSQLYESFYRLSTISRLSFPVLSPFYVELSCWRCSVFAIFGCLLSVTEGMSFSDVAIFVPCYLCPVHTVAIFCDNARYTSHIKLFDWTVNAEHRSDNDSLYTD